MNIAFFGSSLLSSYWNGAATYYRGLIRALNGRGHRVTFYEPDAFGRQSHRDIEPPAWARVVVYENNESAILEQLEAARSADLIVKASGVGTFDTLLEEAVLELRTPQNLIAFWDVDAPATLDGIHADPESPFHRQIPQFDLIFTYGGGEKVVSAYKSLGARRCVPIYNALDPSTHHPVPRDERFECDLALLANRLPDREQRLREFFFDPASKLRGRQFLLAGNGWEDLSMPPNVRSIGHLGTRFHNLFNSSAQAVLNVNRSSMAKYGYSPATRIFEAAGAAACIITDDWDGIDYFFERDSQILVARNGKEVAEHLQALSPARAHRIGNAAFRRALSDHTYSRRAAEVDAVLEGHMAPGERPCGIVHGGAPA